MQPIPDADVRASIAELISFVIGRRLMLMGGTTFETSGVVIEEECVNPWGTNIRNLCAKPSRPPIDFRNDGETLAAILTTLLPRYFVAREVLGLKEALTSYWIARESPLSINLPIFGAAVESLKKSWFASTGSKSKGVHMPREDFNLLAGDLVGVLRSRLTGRGLSEEILKNFAGANRMGLSAQMWAFFEEIGLKVGAQERAAMGARHRSAHGTNGSEDVTELIRFGNAYSTLFERVYPLHGPRPSVSPGDLAFFGA